LVILKAHKGYAPATTSRLVLADLVIAASYLANSLDSGAESQGIAKAAKVVAYGWYRPVFSAVHLS
jgi:hypothetical protein